MQLGFFINQQRCSGCYACVIACMNWHEHEIEPDAICKWRKVVTQEKGIYPEFAMSFISYSCLHCAKPSCIGACPAGAITKNDEDGLVIVDREACWGLQECGGACKEACPYDAPQHSEQKDAKMQKCDLCQPRWQEGKKPICVEACPMRALDAGPMDELKEKYHFKSEVHGFENNFPSVIIKAKKL